MTATLQESVAATVRAELARHNLSRTAAAHAAGMSRTLLWNRLRGETPFTVAELEAIADFIGIPVATFLPTPERAA